jgi:molybdate transport system substrate-binding protein
VRHHHASTLLRRLIVPVYALLFAFSQIVASIAEAAEIKILSSTGVQTIMEDLGPMFERATGHKLTMSFATTVAIMKRVQDGESADVVIAFPSRLESLVAEGKAVAGSVIVVARSGIGVAVRKGAPKPNISSPESLTRTLLAAKSIAYANPARGSPSGTHFAKVIDRLGITNEMKPKTVFPKSGLVGVLALNGEAEIAVQQIPELLQVDGIDLVGPLPSELQATFVYAAVIMNSAKDVAGTKALFDFLHTSDVEALLKAKGFEPAAH